MALCRRDSVSGEVERCSARCSIKVQGYDGSVLEGKTSVSEYFLLSAVLRHYDHCANHSLNKILVIYTSHFTACNGEIAIYVTTTVYILPVGSNAAVSIMR